MLNQVQHDIKKEPGFRKRQIVSEKILKSSDIFDDLVILDSKKDDRLVVMMADLVDFDCPEAIPDCE
jgi:hypothetical protein